MNRWLTIGGTTYTLYRGKFARVRVCQLREAAGWEVCLTVAGHRSRKWFPLAELKAANDYARMMEAERSTHGENLIVREEDRSAVAYYRRWEAQKRKAGHQAPSMLELIQFACSHADERREASTWRQGAAAYLEANLARLKQQRAIIVRRTIERFSETLPNPDVLLDDISVADVQEGMKRMLAEDASPTTFRAYLMVLSGVWKLANEQRLAHTNPAYMALKRMAAPARGEQPTYLPIPACAAMLDAAWRHKNRKEALLFVIGLLTGIRMAERARLQYADFRLDEDEPYINVPAGKAKTHRQRAVYLQGTHADIIRAFMPKRINPDAPLVSGHVHAKAIAEKSYKVQAEFAKAAGVELSRNVLRHTAATYLCAYLESMGKAALILGHSEEMLIRHYRALVTRKEAEGFFRLPVPYAKSSSSRRKSRQNKEIPEQDTKPEP